MWRTDLTQTLRRAGPLRAPSAGTNAILEEIEESDLVTLPVPALPRLANNTKLRSAVHLASKGTNSHGTRNSQVV